MSQLRRTRVTDLLIPLVIVGVAVYLLLQAGYGSLPPMRYITAIPVAVLAIIEFVLARRVRAVVRHDPHAKPMTAISVARSVALGKASALVGAGAVGAVLGLLGRVVPDASSVSAAASDARVGAVLLAACLALMGAGLYLERAGVDPSNTTLKQASTR
jgi:hypothetical protein